MQEETKKKLNVLTGMQTHKLFAWIEDEKQSPYCPEDYPLFPSNIAQQATNDLGFTVTRKNIITAAKALGYIKPKPKAVAAPAALEVSCDHEDKSLLAKALIEVYRLLGKTPMNGLAAIAGTGIKKSSDNPFNL